MRKLSTALLLFSSFFCFGQYAPKAGKTGSTAVFKDSSIFVDWAKSCLVNRGPMSIQYPDSGLASVGKDEFGSGKADAFIVSLGDGGSAVLSFTTPLVDGPGFDFAVFENGFTILANNDSDFLELAFVEVSSDGINFHRFPAYSAIDTNRQQETYDGSKAIKYHNLAGKYIARYGTPFDLAELDTVIGLDLQNITHIKVVDVIGSMVDSFASRGFDGIKINDPWPTLFNQSGFDLDAIGVIHNQQFPNGINASFNKQASVYPNPVKSGTKLFIEDLETDHPWKLYSINGEELLVGQGNEIELSAIQAGIYLLMIIDYSPLKIIVQ